MSLITLRKSGTSGEKPASLALGELAINYADGLLFFADASNIVHSIPLLQLVQLFSGALTAPVSFAPGLNQGGWFPSPNGASTLKIFDDNNSHVESSSVLWINGNSGAVTHFGGQALGMKGGGGGGSAFLAQSGSNPSYGWQHLSAPADQNKWDQIAVPDSLLFRSINDSESIANVWMQAIRSGANISKLVINAALLLSQGITTNGIVFNNLATDGVFHQRLQVPNVTYDVGWRFDGGSLYLMRSKTGVGQGWDGSRPIVYDATNNRLNLVTDGAPLSIGGSTTISGGTLTLNSPGTAAINITGGGSGTGMQIQSFMSGKTRWLLRLGDGSAESGSNAGSNVDWHSYNDDGSYLRRVFSINRASGTAYFDQRPSWAGTTPYDTGNLSAGQLNNIAGQTLYGTGNLSAGQLNNIAGQTLYGTSNLTNGALATIFTYWPAVNYSGTRHVGLNYDGSNVNNIVDDGGGYWTSWDSHNFNPASKANVDSMTTVGYNNGNANRPYFNGGAGYTDLAYSREGNTRAIGVGGQGQPYFYQPDQNAIYYAARTNGNNLISIRWNGSNACFLVDSTEFALQAASDARLKNVEGAVEIDDATAKLAAIKPVTYEYNEKYELMSQTPGRRYGFVAQELEQVIPTAIQDGAPNEDGTQYKLLSADAAVQLCALLIKSNQAMLERIAALEAKIK